MLTAFKPVKTLKLVIKKSGINWLPLIKDLHIEHFTLNGSNVSRNDLL